ncbi:MAG: GAF domain-containing protein [Bacteroidetes bacterium]|nr:GAF domain-containing protein [Bacteroidota bacterium]
MKSLKNYKLVAIITIIVFVIFELFLFQELIKIVSDIKKLSNSINDYSGVITFFVIGLLLGLFLFAISLKILSLKFNNNVTKTLNFSKKETKEKIDEIAEDEKKSENETEIEKTTNLIFEELKKIDNIKLYTDKFLINLAKEYEIVQGLFYLKFATSEDFIVYSKYAYFNEEEPKSFKIGEGLSGQVAKNKKAMNLSEIPDNYIKIVSGTGIGTPRHLLILPIIKKENTIGIVELASFIPFEDKLVKQLVLLFEKNSDIISQLMKN